MAKYPFSPELLDALPEELAEIFRALEDTLLSEICARLNVGDQLNEITVQDIKTLRSHGIDLDEITKAIKKATGLSDKKLEELLEDVVKRNQRYYDELITIADVTKPETLVSAADISAIKTQCQRDFANITGSLGFLVDGGRTMLAPAKAYQWALDRAVLQVESGAVSYQDAIKAAVTELANSGIKTVSYESGHVDQIDVSVRRAVMTGVNQLCAKYTEQSAEWLETPYYEVSAHIGARDKEGASPWSSHKNWQGRVYSVRAGDIYPSIYEVCGLGAVDGLEGANCRHKRSAWVEGVSERTYTDEQLAHIDDGHDCTCDGKHYTAYEATQMQRRIERTIRKQKRLKAAYQSAGLTEDAQTANIKLRRLNTKYREFSRAAGLPEQRERMKVTYVDDASTSAAEKLKAQRAAEAPIRADIKSGKYPLALNLEKQARHMADTAPAGRSVVTVSAEELQKIINEKAGSGKINFVKSGFSWKHTEIVAADKEIGYTVNSKGEKKPAQSLKIHYSSTGTHAVPFSGWWKK